MIIGRILQFIEYKKINKRTFYKETGLSNGFLDKVKDIGSSKIEKILYTYPDISTNWLVLGEGSMLKEEAKQYKTEVRHDVVNKTSILNYFSKTKEIGGVPYWDLAVSAGHSLIDIAGKNKPSGYVVGLPGADIAENIFPVTGMSMEPEVTSSAIIGVRKIDNWETLNTERIYLIITRDDRMIKRIEHDEQEPEILWCVSPNYPKFKVYKSDIIEIQRVCFVYNPT